MGAVVGVGNCQVQGMVRWASAALGLSPVYLHPSKLKQDRACLIEALNEAELVVATIGPLVNEMRDAARSCGRPDLPVLAAPKFHFLGFHPDVAFPSTAEGERPELPMGNANSAILLAAWRDELGASEALSLFRDDVFDALGYYDAFDLASEMLIGECSRAGFEVKPFIQSWMANGPFVYLPLHPKLEVLHDVTLAQLRAAGLYDRPFIQSTLDDELSRNLIWPVYPEIADRLGFVGDYLFRPKHRGKNADPPPLDLEAFVERTYSCFEQSPPHFPSFTRMSDRRLEGIRRFLRRRPQPQAANPYKALPSGNWWSKSVAECPPDEVDPVVGVKFSVTRDDRVATAGSCFAQHLARRLTHAGFNYLVTEQAPPDCPDPAAEDYGVFTARFGNIYTARQLLQLADRAYGRFEPAVDAWELSAGGFVDPFRPRIGKPFEALRELRAARDVHFAAVRQMFETADVFVFTLGLTEAWWSCDDQAVVPIAPAVVGARVAADAYEPKNFTAMEVTSDLQRLSDLFHTLNPAARILLTVSPVPLIATFEEDHVLAATTYSKSVLRVAAGEVARNRANVAYFPSYEIITGSFTRGRYFADDLRQVTTAGVDHVMKCFLRHYALGSSTGGRTDENAFRSEIGEAMNVVCDEEEIEAAVERQQPSLMR